MDDFINFVIILLVWLGTVGFVAYAEHKFTESDIAYECKTYSATTIDSKVFNCTPRGDK